MKYRWRIGRIPDGNTPLANQSVMVRRVSDGATLTTLTSDADGFIELNGDGHYPPFYLHLSGVPGGDKYWRSDEVHGAGAISLAEIPHALRAMDDGVVRGRLNALAPSLNGTTLTLATGTALCAGYPVDNGTADQFALTRPVTSTRIDRLVAWVRPAGASSNPGEAGFSVRTGVEGAAVTALVTTADLHETALATITVPIAGALTLVDDRLFAGEKEPEYGVARVASISTASTTGEALAGLSVTLDLPRSGTYDIEVVMHGIHTPATVWELQATYGQLGAGNDDFNTPGQVAIDQANDWIYIADTANNRIVKRLLSTGAYVAQLTSLNATKGVAVDPSGNVYVTFFSGGTAGRLKKFNSALVSQWDVLLVSGSDDLRHVATDGTNVFVTSATNVVFKRLCSTGAAGSPATWGSAGTGNGQFSTPYGIAVSGGEVYVVDQGNSRVQVFTTAGVYVRQWAISANARGIALDTSGNVLVAEFGSDVVKRYSNVGAFLDQFSQADPDGVAVASGDVVWVTNATSDNLTKWDEGLGGYGSLAIEIDGVVGDYIAVGERVQAITNAASGSKAGPGTVTIRAFGKTTENTTNFSSCVLSAKASPQR